MHPRERSGGRYASIHGGKNRSLIGSERVYMEMSLKDIFGVRVTCGTTDAQGFNQKIDICVPILLIHSANLVKSRNCSGPIHSPI